MKHKNVYKPRYKIAFQAKKKNWIYKNCAMRRFFNIRGRKIQRRGYFKRYVLVLNNIKWTVARRYIKPYRHKRRPGRNKKRYSLRFYTKQLVRNFYGKVKETAFQQFLRTYLSSVKKRNNSFFAALERRLDMVVFRMKFLPTIFACNQLIHHYGICVNEQVQKTPHFLVTVGDIITLPYTYWKPIFYSLNQLIVYRVYGAYIAGRREYRLHLKRFWCLKKTRYFKRKNFALIRKNFNMLSFINIFTNEMVRYESVFKGALVKSLSKYIRRKWKKTFSEFKINKQYEDSSKKISELLKKIFKLCAQGKTFIKRFRIKQKKRRRVYIRKWRWKKHYSFFFKLVTFNINIIRTLNYLIMCVYLEEIRAERNIIISFFLRRHSSEISSNKFNETQDDEKYVDLLKTLWYDEQLVIEEYLYIVNALRTLYRYVLKKKIKRKMKSFWKNRARKRIVKILSRRKKKQKRLRMASRLRPYHWYIPRYLEVNWRTMTGMLIAPPKNKEVFLPFRCNLKKIYSFYRSRGY